MQPPRSRDGKHAVDGASQTADAVVRDVPALVGANLRRLRKSQGHSLDRLAELSGVSRAMLGQIETGKSAPTVSLLWKVADALGVPVATLIQTASAPAVVVLVRGQGEIATRSDGKFLRRQLFSHGRAQAAGFYEVRIAPRHRESPDLQPPGTKQTLVVAHGSVTVSVADETPINLAEGDAIQFDASAAHSFDNASGAEAVVYIVVATTA